MVAGKYRARTFRRVKVKTPGGRVVVHFRKRKPAKAQCGVCGAELKGVPRVRALRLKSMTKSQKRPERPYGGVLCSRCMRQKIIDSVVSQGIGGNPG